MKNYKRTSFSTPRDGPSITTLPQGDTEYVINVPSDSSGEPARILLITGTGLVTAKFYRYNNVLNTFAVHAPLKFYVPTGANYIYFSAIKTRKFPVYVTVNPIDGAERPEDVFSVFNSNTVNLHSPSTGHLLGSLCKDSAGKAPEYTLFQSETDLNWVLYDKNPEGLKSVFLTQAAKPLVVYTKPYTKYAVNSLFSEIDFAMTPLD